MTVEKLIREYFKFDDINQTETIEVLPLTIVDLLLDYEKIQVHTIQHILNDGGYKNKILICYKNEKLQCFKCKQYKELDCFNDNRMKFQLKSQFGKVQLCKECLIERAKINMEALQYNFEIGKFETIEFKNEKEIIDFYESRR